jgi:hypothetical protein
MLFYAILPAIFDNVAFNLTKIVKGTFLGPFGFWLSGAKNRTKLA